MTVFRLTQGYLTFVKIPRLRIRTIFHHAFLRKMRCSDLPARACAGGNYFKDARLKKKLT